MLGILAPLDMQHKVDSRLKSLPWHGSMSRFPRVTKKGEVPTVANIVKDELIIVGIDPGSRFVGFGAVRATVQKIEFLSYGVIAPPEELDFNTRVGVIAKELEVLFQKLRPDVTVIEHVFLGRNADSAFKLGHARGVAVAAAVRAESEVVEYAARAVKKGITGNGAASKGQVQTVLGALLGLKGRVQADASDALALAFFHARNLDVIYRLNRQMKEMES